MEKKVSQRVKSLVSATLIAGLLLINTLPAIADGFVFEDWDSGSVEQRDSASSATESNLDDAVAASGSELLATSSIALFARAGVSSLGDIWDGWNGDFSFLDGSSGDGSERKPYQIKNKSQLMGFSQLVAMGMRVQAGEGDSNIIGSYDGKYFKLMNNIDLGGMNWNPIGFYQDSSELSGDVVNKFFGHFDGNGKTISNFKLSDTTWNQVGFFGAIEDATIENLTLKPGKTVYGKNQVAILAGSAVNSKLTNCTVNGGISAAGTAGGIVGTVEGAAPSESVIENCTECHD